MKFPTYGEYKRLFKKAERILDREVVKPLGKRDDTLIKECEETMLFCIERMKALQPEVEEASARSRLRGLRLPQTRLARAAIAFCAVLLILAVTASVGQAFGVKFWSALVHWDKNYLRIDYSVNGRDDPPKGEYRPSGTEAVGSETEIKTILFDSEEGIREYLGALFIYPYGMDELEFISAEAEEDDGGVIYAEADTLYAGSPLRISASFSEGSTPEESSAYTTIRQGSFDSVEIKLINGVECVCASSAERSILIFSVDQNVYTLIGKVPVEQLELIAAEMLQ